MSSTPTPTPTPTPAPRTSLLGGTLPVQPAPVRPVASVPAAVTPGAAPTIATAPAVTAPPPVTPSSPNIYRPNILIIGDSGTGKTSSLRNLPWADVEFVDAEQKGLPFDGTPVNYKAPKNSTAIENAMFNSRKPIVVLDSLTKYIELLDAEMNEAYSGYEVWAQYNKRLAAFLNRCKSADRTFIVTAIPELITVVAPDGMSNSNERRVQTRGKGWEGKIEKEFAFVFFTLYRTDPKATPPRTTYHFQTNAAGVNRAKSPIGVFADLYIDNDIAAALAKMEAHRKARAAATT